MPIAPILLFWPTWAPRVFEVSDYGFWDTFTLEEPSSTPISGDAGDAQSIETETVSLYEDYGWHPTFEEPSSTPVIGDCSEFQDILEDLAFYAGSTFSPPTDLPISSTDLFAWKFAALEPVLDLNILLLYDMITEQSLTDAMAIPGREGGITKYLGSHPDRIYFRVRAHRQNLNDLIARGSLKIKFQRYGLTWWEGTAITENLIHISSKSGAAAEFLDIFWVLTGKQGSVSNANLGLIQPDTPPQEIKLVYWNQSFGWSKTLYRPDSQAISFGAGAAQSKADLASLDSGFSWTSVLDDSSIPE